MADGLLNGSDSVTGLSYYEGDNRLAVAQDGGKVDLMFNGVVEQTFSTGLPTISTVAYGRGSLLASDGTTTLWHFNKSLTGVDLGITGVVDAIFFDLQFDSNSNWSNNPAVKATSWYAEVGEFLSFGVIIATATTVTIYKIVNGLPVSWMVFEGGAGNVNNMINADRISSVDYKDGILFVGSGGAAVNGVWQVSFIEDSAERKTVTSTIIYNSNIADRNAAAGFTNVGGERIVNSNVNDVAAKVLSSTEVENLLLWSEDLTNEEWIKSPALTVAESTDSPSAVGTSYIATVDGTGNNFDRVSQENVVGTIAAGSDYTATFYIKESTSPLNRVRIESNTGSRSYDIEFVNGVPNAIEGSSTGDGLSDSQSITFLPDSVSGWYRGAMTVRDMVASTNLELTFYPEFNVDTDKSVHIAACQLEIGANPHDYVKTEATTVTGTVKPAKQLVNRTNEALWSEDIGNPVWVTSQGATTTSPDIIVFDTQSASRVAQTYTVTGTYTWSVDMRGTVGGEAVRLNLVDNGVGTTDVNFTLTTEWQRYTVTGDFTTGLQQTRLTTGNGGAVEQTINVRNMQFEQSSAPTPYIPTEANAATVTDNTGLFIPTWAAATDGGVSVGVDTEQVWDITGQTNQGVSVGFTADDKVLYTWQFGSNIGIYDVPVADILYSDQIRKYHSSPSGTDPGAPKVLNEANDFFVQYIAAGDQLAVADDSGLTLIDEDYGDYFNGSANWITTEYQTGPMVAPDGAWANDTGTDPIGFPGVQ